jgi:hypothetical protein
MSENNNDNDGLSRPIDAYIKYFRDIKPYHSKILEILEQYNFSEEMLVSMREGLTISLTVVAPSPTPTVTPTFTPTQTVTPQVTPTPSVTPAVTVTPSVTPTQGVSVTPSLTPPITPTRTATSTRTPTPTPTRTRTPTVTPTPSPVALNDGYTMGGERFGTKLIPVVQNAIDRFPFAAPFTTATDIGDLSVARDGASGQGSTSDGYTSGGGGPGITGALDTIDRFPFSSPFATATDVGDLSETRDNRAAGHQSDSDGYVSGGGYTLLSPPSPVILSSIDRFPFSLPFTAAAGIANLTQTKQFVGGHSSRTEGEASVSGGSPNPSPTSFSLDTVERFPFSSPFTTANDVGNLGLAGRRSHAANSGPSRGYVAGGFSGSPGATTNRIEAFPFANPFVISSNIGDLSPQGAYSSNASLTGQNSISNGYVTGRGYGIITGIPTTITRFPFSSPFTLTTDVGDLALARVNSAGTQGA